MEGKTTTNIAPTCDCVSIHIFLFLCLIFNTSVSDCSDLHLCVCSCVLDTDSLSWWHNSQVWNLGHSWAREVPQFSPHVLQRCASCNCCLRYHKPGMHVYFSIMCNSLWWWLLEMENKKRASVHHIHSGLNGGMINSWVGTLRCGHNISTHSVEG